MLMRPEDIMKQKMKVIAVTNVWKMKTCSCRNVEEKKLFQAESSGKGVWRRFFGWGLPGLGLFFIPKCPLCVAAYISMATGLGLNFSQASWIRAGMIIFCSASAIFFLMSIAKAYRVSKRKFTHQEI